MGSETVRESETNIWRIAENRETKRSSTKVLNQRWMDVAAAIYFDVLESAVSSAIHCGRGTRGLKIFCKVTSEKRQDRKGNSFRSSAVVRL